MSPDDEKLMAYADGELDPLAARRVERAMADDPALTVAVESHRALRGQLGAAFAPVTDEPVPESLAAMLPNNVAALVPRPTPPPRRWLSGLAIAASLVVGVALGTQWQGVGGPVTANDGGLIATGDLARTLDTQLASASGTTRVSVSFRDANGSYCRVFAAPALGGIACKDNRVWQLRQTRASGARQDTAYRQADSGEASLMAAAQKMMAGAPLDAAGEERARASGWR